MMMTRETSEEIEMLGVITPSVYNGTATCDNLSLYFSNI